MRGLNKIFPCGSTCEFNGKTVPCFVGWSSKGSITSALLAAMLKRMDVSECFDRSDGIDPFLLIDGHGSRFKLPFVEYIHGDYGSNVWIRVPYDTSLWQVGDRKQQNGQYKNNSKEDEEKLLPMKTK
jgi:hypothetical protein